MTTAHDPVPDIVASGREIHGDDCEMLWTDLIEGRCSWQETSQRAEALISTVNVPNPIVNSGLLSLYYLWKDDVRRDPASQTAVRESWRQALREQDADRHGWYRRHYQAMLTDHGLHQGAKAAASFGARLVKQGMLARADVDTVLEQFERNTPSRTSRQTQTSNTGRHDCGIGRDAWPGQPRSRALLPREPSSLSGLKATGGETADHGWNAR